MAFNFPSSPTDGQEFTPITGVTYVYYNPRWLVKPSKVDVAGDTMTGDLTVTNPTTNAPTVSVSGQFPAITIEGDPVPTLALKTGADGYNRVSAYVDDKRRWEIYLGDGTYESGGDVGSDFVLWRAHDGGGLYGTPALRFTRLSGLGVVAGPPTEANGVATKGYVDSAAFGITALAVKLGPPTADAILFGDLLNPKCGQTFVAAGNTITSIAEIELMWIGSLVDDVIVRVYSLNTSRFPSAQVGVDSSAIGAGMSSSAFTAYTATFATPVPVTPGVEYAFVLERTGAVSGFSRFFAHVSNLPTYSKGNYITYNGTAWSHVYYQDVPVTINYTGDANSLITYTGPGDHSKVNRHGDNLTGFLTLHANPTSGSHAANKTYADLKVPIAGGFMTGNLQVPKLTVENSTLPIVALHQGGNPKWVVAGDTTEFSVSSDDFGTVAKPLAINYTTGVVAVTSPLTLPAANPTTAQQAAHKQYVDQAIATAIAGLFPTELRFTRTSSQHMTRLYGTTSSLAWTLSMWVKRVGLATRQALFGVESTSGAGKLHIEFDVANTLSLYGGAAGDTAIAVGPAFTSTTLWYHIVWSVPAGAPSSPRFHTINVNNSGAMTGIISGNGINNAETHYIGQPSGYPDVLMKDVVFVDGAQLPATDFGGDVSGVWTPKVYGGPFGTNGFKLNFANRFTPASTNLGRDVSGNDNHWTAVNF